MKRKILIIGNGKFSESLNKTKGFDTVCVLNRSSIYSNYLNQFAECDIIWILTPDRIIANVVADLISFIQRNTALNWNEKSVIHSSGTVSINVFKKITKFVQSVFSLHPNISITGTEPIPKGRVWGLTSDDYNKDLVLAKQLLNPTEPVIVKIDDNQKALYHTAASFAANFSVALFEISRQLYTDIGLDTEVAKKIVSEFFISSVKNSLASNEFPITGPIARKDTAVVKKQFKALKGDKDLENLFLDFKRIIEKLG